LPILDPNLIVGVRRLHATGGVSQREIARRLPISRTKVAEIVAGRCRDPPPPVEP